MAKTPPSPEVALEDARRTLAEAKESGDPDQIKAAMQQVVDQRSATREGRQGYIAVDGDAVAPD